MDGGICVDLTQGQEKQVSKHRVELPEPECSKARLWDFWQLLLSALRSPAPLINADGTDLNKNLYRGSTQIAGSGKENVKLGGKKLVLQRQETPPPVRLEMSSHKKNNIAIDPYRSL